MVFSYAPTTTTYNSQFFFTHPPKKPQLGTTPNSLDVKCSNKPTTYFKFGFFNFRHRSEKHKILRATSKLGFKGDVERVLESDGGFAGVEIKSNYDAIVIGSGIGGLVAATQLAVKGARVLVLEKYVIPGGSSGFYQRDGYTFDVGSSVMFGFSDKVSSLLNSFPSHMHIWNCLKA